jgi:hypothetical protein
LDEEGIKMNKQYMKDPSSIKFSKQYTEFNPMHNVSEYASTLESMSRIGQTDPILIRGDECVDGRNRVKACMQLGIQVSCIDVDANMNKENLILLCNKGLTSGRVFDVSQRAIQALKMVTEYNYTAVDASILWQVDKRVITYASTVVGFGRQDILSDLIHGTAVQLENMERPSKSLEVICRQLKKLGEKNVVENTDERIKWDPESLIKTEAGKAWFYDQAEKSPEIKVSHHLIASFIELANHKFKKSTGAQS